MTLQESMQVGSQCQQRFNELNVSAHAHEATEGHRGRLLAVPIEQAAYAGKLVPHLMQTCMDSQKDWDSASANRQDQELLSQPLRAAFEGLQAMQRLVYLNARCPEGSFALLTKAGYRLCVLAQKGSQQDSLVRD